MCMHTTIVYILMYYNMYIYISGNTTLVYKLHYRLYMSPEMYNAVKQYIIIILEYVHKINVLKTVFYNL